MTIDQIAERADESAGAAQRKAWEQERPAREAFREWAWEVGWGDAPKHEAARIAFMAGYAIAKADKPKET